jgi:hypothetical protein
MKNLHLIPTNKLSKLLVRNDKPLVLMLKEHSPFANNETHTYKHIYITSDKEIKEGVDQWYLDKFLNKPRNSGGAQYSERQDVIILTTDEDLIKDGVQAINDEFLEWFVKNPSCEFVKVENQYRVKSGTIQEHVDGIAGYEYYEYKIIIPQEEKCTCEVGSPYNNLCCKIHGSTPREEDEHYLDSYGCTKNEFELSLNFKKEETKQEWKPKEGEEVWIKVFSNWSSGKYIGYDVDKKLHLVREPEEGGGHLFASSDILPYSVLPTESKQETLEEAAKNTTKIYVNEREKQTAFLEFINGAKWQAERMYSEEEVLKAQQAILGNIKDALQNKNYIINYLKQLHEKKVL